MGSCIGHQTYLNKKIPVVVTGANGYVASHVIKNLLDAGYKVKGTVRSLAKKEKYDFLYDLHPKAKQNVNLIEADLNDNQIWDNVLKGAEAVLHVATPLTFDSAKEEEMIKTAKEGMKAITQAAARQGVKKFIYTSSIVTLVDELPGNKGDNIGASDWGNVEKMNGYSKSKYHAEKELWEFHKANKGEIEVSTILPSLVLGPILGKSNLSTLGLFSEFVGGKIPGYLKDEQTVALVDVRDLGILHLKALESQKSNGKRFIGASENITIKQFLQILDDNYSKLGYVVNNKETTFEELGKAAYGGSMGAGFSMSFAGKGANFDNSETRNVLNHTFYKPEQTIVDGFNSLIKYEFLQK